MTLKEIRLKRQIKQAELAQAVGVQQVLISVIETGAVVPNPTLKRKIEQYLGEPVDWEKMTMDWKIKYREGAEKPKEVRVRK